MAEHHFDSTMTLSGSKQKRFEGEGSFINLTSAGGNGGSAFGS